jgi:hypothetical protein
MRKHALSVALAIATMAGPIAGLAFPGDASASVSIAVTWEGLLHESAAAAVATPIESRANWENGRIYTYTHVRVDRVVAGEAPLGTDLWIRTMGGVVGKIGQIVEGEAAFADGLPSLLFLRSGPAGSFEVTARAQGQFPVVAATPSAPARVIRNRAAGAIFAPPQVVASSKTTRLAADVLHGRSVDDAVSEVAADWTHIHARP